MRVLALSPYHGGSHAQFFDSWLKRTPHEVTLLTFPARHFPWRMRQASVGFAEQASRLFDDGQRFDSCLSTSMMDTAEFLGLLPPMFRTLPLVTYFHENQLCYPVRKNLERDQHLSFINWASALSSDENWFNSRFNLESFVEELRVLLRKMPDEPSLDTIERIAARSRVMPPLVELDAVPRQTPGPLHIAWVGRWEHDKRPDIFFAALRKLRQSGTDFRLTCLGQSFRECPDDFRSAPEEWNAQLEHFGYAPTRAEYLSRLGRCDVVVSSADHEFFGVALLEAVASGCIPLVPDRLVYPEIYPAENLYPGDADSLAHALCDFANLKATRGTLQSEYASRNLRAVVERYDASLRARAMDERLVDVVTSRVH